MSLICLFMFTKQIKLELSKNVPVAQVLKHIQRVLKPELLGLSSFVLKLYTYDQIRICMNLIETDC